MQFVTLIRGRDRYHARSMRTSGFVFAGLALSALVWWGAGRAAAVADGTPDRLVLEPCRLDQADRLQSYAADCGTLSVPENRDSPGGRTLPLFVARIPAVSRRKLPDPLFLVAGGPGQSTVDFYTSVAPVFARIVRNRDLILVDQRGTGRSRRLDCPFDDELMLRAGPANLAAAARSCRERLEATADLRQFTTSVAVRDLDQVRRALGLARINLYGISYGTRVVQHYARRYPQATRAVILDGVVAPQTVLGPEMAADADAALERILERCRAAPTCRERFTDPAADYRALRAALAARPIAVRIPDPHSGALRSLEFTDANLAMVVRLASYSADQAAVLPLALHLARVDSDFAALAASYLLAQRSVNAELATGMQESVICAEDQPFLGSAAGVGDALIEGMTTVCGEWVRGVLDPDFHAPFSSAAAALLLSGADDPVTPPGYAELAARDFADHALVVMPGLGHGQLVAPCIDRVMAAFLDAGTARGLDTRCTERVRPMPFFTSRAGPGP